MITDEMLETREIMEGIAAGLDRILNGEAHGTDRKYAFVLLIAPFSDEATADERGKVNYVSNASRDDIQPLLKEMVERWKEPGAVQEVPPTSSGSSKKDVY